MITTTITYPDEKASKIFIAEEKEMMNKRAEYEVKNNEKETIFTIRAKDSTALRAAINSICKALIIYEKTKKAIKNE